MSASIFLFILSQPFYGVGIGVTIDPELNIAPVQEEHISFLLSSHNMLEIEFVSDRVGIISKGHLMVTGRTDELKERYNAANLEEVFERVVIENEVH